MTATYNGDPTSSPSASTGAPVTVGHAATATTGAASTAATVVGQPVTYTATVAVTPPGDTTPTGTVAFTDGTTVVCAHVAHAATAPYTATCTHAWPATGRQVVIAAYSGDTTTTASTSKPVTVHVHKAASAITEHPPATSPLPPRHPHHLHRHRQRRPAQHRRPRV